MTLRNFCLAFGALFLVALVLDQMPRRQSQKTETTESYKSVDLFVDPAEEAARIALDRTIDLRLDEASLYEATNRLSGKLGITIVIDEAALNEKNVTPELTTSVEAKNMTARDALRLILEPEGLACYFLNGSLTITTQRTDCENWKIRIYDVADLVSVKSNSPTTAFDFEPVVELLKFAVSPDTREDVGGPGVVKEFETDGTAVLLIRQTPSVHAEIDILLTKLRLMRHRGLSVHGSHARNRANIT